ncbi:MAG: bifunctional isocitrate dehydrogenase kinase/phosphatase [Burkholderiales bacterium]|jgi:isocitrate dehydrogenase kinase/phosphatase|nr:bifunctional isocitrate dehydrogenase kinase/phosphatase [Burkholderiales bacterium]
MNQGMTQLIAQTILQGFDAQYGRFLEITAGAQRRFENAEWQNVQKALKERIHLYDHHVELSVELITRMAGDEGHDPTFLAHVKDHYIERLADYPRFEIAESFFNSVYRRLFQHRDALPDNMFVQTSQPHRTHPNPRPLAREFPLENGVEDCLRMILRHTPLRLPWEDLPRDINDIHQYLLREFDQETLKNGVLEIYNELFYRNKAAWLVGKLRLKDGVRPFLLPIHRSDAGELYIDTCLTTFPEASIVFGFNRAYFMVYAPLPMATVEWLHEILPKKNAGDLYSAIGCQKHGKTEYYREYLAYLETTDEQFIIAPGIPGMVMLVFTMPSYDRVFKVIKDRFAPQKNTTEANVRACYQLVKEHDRVGRMADTQEYKNFVLDKNRVSPELMNALLKEASEKTTDFGDKIVIHHLYVECRMTPLNIFMETANEQQRRDAIEEYGNAIKNLASADIFPGDMLLKNFGITANGRVVFYDYDEIRHMTEMNFRDIPLPRYPEEEFASEPWYSVGEDDVFPEEFRSFFYSNPEMRRLFEELHGDLYKPEYWRYLQQRIRDGEIEDVFAYRKKQRFRQR